MYGGIFPYRRFDTTIAAHRLLSSRRVKILWVKAGKLLPVDTGGKIRSFNLLRHLNAKHEVTLLSYYGGARDREYELKLGGIFPRAVAVPIGGPDSSVAAATFHYAGRLFRRAPFAVSRFTASPVCRLIEEWDKARRFDVSVCDFLAASANFPRRPHTPSVLFQHNVESVLWSRRAATDRSALKRLVYAVEAARMKHYERETVRRFEHVIAVSDADRAAMADMTNLDRISVVPTGVDTGLFRPSIRNESPEPIVLFLGSMDWEPNADGVQYFAEAIWPAIRAAVPSARLQVVGRNPTTAIRRLASQCIEIVGTVPSVLEYLHRAAIVVVPLRVGGGTRLKIFEAMGAGKAVVSTTIGAEGLDVVDGRDILLADTPAAFSAAAIRLLRDSGERRRLEDAALGTASRYDWQAIAERFETILARAIDHAATPAHATGGKAAA
jgi:glycosyltransferase involved in cell wall biosynthesis